jgi:hypothetical protein
LTDVSKGYYWVDHVSDVGWRVAERKEGRKKTNLPSYKPLFPFHETRSLLA